MGKAFERDIPRYPDEVGFAPEPPRDLPTANASLLANPYNATALSFIGEFVAENSNSSIRAAVLQKLVQFAQGHQAICSTINMLTMLAADPIREDQSPTAALRRKQYGELLEKVSSRILPKTSEHHFPDSVLPVVNNALKEAFPQEFGTLIPELTEEVVTVVTDESLVRYLQRGAFHNNHPERFRLFAQAGERSGRYYATFGDKESKPMNVVDRDLPNSPIFILESEITDILALDELPLSKKMMFEVARGRVLVHENFHRAVKPAEMHFVPEDDTFIFLAFSADRREAALHTNTEMRRHYLEAIDQLADYARQHNPQIKIAGTTISLFCDDENGFPKVVAVSGADLEEGIVELFSHMATIKLIAYAKGNYPTSYTSPLDALFDQHLQGMHAYSRVNTTSLVEGYLQLLGFTSLQDALPAFISGDIPYIHRRLYPTKEYLF